MEPLEGTGKCECIICKEARWAFVHMPKKDEPHLRHKRRERKRQLLHRYFFNPPDFPVEPVMRMALRTKDGKLVNTNQRGKYPDAKNEWVACPKEFAIPKILRLIVLRDNSRPVRMRGALKVGAGWLADHYPLLYADVVAATLVGDCVGNEKCLAGWY